MSKYDPTVFFGTERFNIEKANNIHEAEVEALKEQNNYLKALAEAANKATKTAEESAKSSEKSAKASKICTIVSVVIAGLMFIATVIGISFDIWKFNKEQITKQHELPETTQPDQEELSQPSRIL